MATLSLCACSASPPASPPVPLIGTLELGPGGYGEAREALVSSIENEGLVISATSAFADMLARTDVDLQHGAGKVYAHAEVLFFCSARIAASLALENPANAALCPLSMAIFQRKGSDRVELAWRGPENATPGGAAARALLRRIAERAQADLPPAAANTR